MKKGTILICLVSLSWGSYAQQGHEEHFSQQQTQGRPAVFVEKEVNRAYAAYLDLQQALVNSSQIEAEEAALCLEGVLKETVYGNGLYIEAARFAAAGSLKAQREVFTSLSEKMAAFLKKQELAEGRIYVGYCSMANQNEGGSWLAAFNEIRNPYFGSKMLECGGIKEIIPPILFTPWQEPDDRTNQNLNK